MNSATIKIFLVHGDPKRLRTAELSNWTGKAVAGPRSEFDEVVGRDESIKFINILNTLERILFYEKIQFSRLRCF